MRPGQSNASMAARVASRLPRTSNGAGLVGFRDGRRRMVELAQLPWWQRLKWRRLRPLQQLQAPSFGGGAGGLRCAVRTPVRHPGCWGGACKNPRDAGARLVEGEGRGQGSGGSELGVTWVWEAGRANSHGTGGSPRRAGLPPVLDEALHPVSSSQGFPGDPRRAPRLWRGAAKLELPFRCLLSPWRPRVTLPETSARVMLSQ